MDGERRTESQRGRSAESPVPGDKGSSHRLLHRRCSARPSLRQTTERCAPLNLNRCSVQPTPPTSLQPSAQCTTAGSVQRRRRRGREQG